MLIFFYLRPSIITGHSAHMEEVTIIPSVGVDTTNSNSISQTGNLSFLAQSKKYKRVGCPKIKQYR